MEGAGYENSIIKIRPLKNNKLSYGFNTIWAKRLTILALQKNFILMTAVVGILNKRAVAIAADSAVTYNDGKKVKIYNQANKIFTLSKFHPVAIMIYNGADFMETPWEIIIKVYRKNLKDNKFDTLLEYQKDFFLFLKAKNFYATSESKANSFRSYLININRDLIDSLYRQNQSLDFKNNVADRQTALTILETIVDGHLAHWSAKTDFMEDFVDFTYAEFLQLNQIELDKITQYFFIDEGLLLSVSLKDKIYNLYFHISRFPERFIHFTGLVFVGFGETEIYSSLIPINTSFAIGDRLRYYIDNGNAATIGNNSSSAICPFAQVDVINTILMGVDPILKDTYRDSFIDFLDQYNTLLLQAAGNGPNVNNNLNLQALIGSINKAELIKKYIEFNEDIINVKYITPLLDAVSSLSKEDLAEMAESLIYLTYLKRRITNSEESVGGPVDVALLTKGDGFIWIKRKHYFKAELNNHFIQNYFKP